MSSIFILVGSCGSWDSFGEILNFDADGEWI